MSEQLYVNNSERRTFKELAIFLSIMDLEMPEKERWIKDICNLVDKAEPKIVKFEDGLKRVKRTTKETLHYIH